MNDRRSTDYLSVNQALDEITKQFKPSGKEVIDLLGALGRVLASDIKATLDMPAFTNSSMDGFGVIASDINQIEPGRSVILEIIEDIPAGKEPNEKLRIGTAVRIMTGAILPAGADTVVPVELTNHKNLSSDQDILATVEILQKVKKGDYIRIKGSDIQKGSVILREGQKLRARDIGLLAMMGYSEIKVYKKPRIAVGSSGDELMEIGGILDSAKIFDSNGPMLRSLVEKSGGVPVDLGIIRDLPDSVVNALEQAKNNHVELIVSSGGVSVGAYDYIRKVIEERGKLTFWRINMRPGKPIAFGEYQSIPFIGLPGNPVSAFVGFILFVRVAIRLLSGLGSNLIRTERVILEEDFFSDGRESYLRAIVSKKENKYYASLTGDQGSGNLLSLVEANALLIVPSEVKSVRSGEQLEAWLIDDID